MKKYILLIVLIGLLGITWIFKEQIVVFYINHFIQVEKEVKLSGENSYYQEQDFKFVQTTKEFSPKNKQDLLNIYYTIINSGKEESYFYCPEEYASCISDVKDIANDQTMLSHINNFVHPFNGFKHIETEYDSLGRVTIRIEKTYSKEKIYAVNQQLSKIYKEEIDKNKSDEDKIKQIHDYIINHSKYDSERSDSKIVKYDSDTAYGNLVQGYGLCGGYTDSMALFLNLLGIKNFKVSSENHVWNALLLDGKWYHLDLTWDDPITTDGSDILEYNFFLITTEELKEVEDRQHNFPTDIYQELKA